MVWPILILTSSCSKAWSLDTSYGSLLERKEEREKVKRRRRRRRRKEGWEETHSFQQLGNGEEEGGEGGLNMYI